MPRVSPIIKLSLLGAVATVTGLVVTVGCLVGGVVGDVVGCVVGLGVGLVVGVLVDGARVTCWKPVTCRALTAEEIWAGLLRIILSRTSPGRTGAVALWLVAGSVT